MHFFSCIIWNNSERVASRCRAGPPLITGLGWWRHLEARRLIASYRVDFVLHLNRRHSNSKTYGDNCEKEIYLSKKVFFSIYLHTLHWKWRLWEGEILQYLRRLPKWVGKPGFSKEVGGPSSWGRRGAWRDPVEGGGSPEVFCLNLPCCSTRSQGVLENLKL